MYSKLAKDYFKTSLFINNNYNFNLILGGTYQAIFFPSQNYIKDG